MSGTRRARHWQLGGAAAMLVASGCARLVTLDPAMVSKLNDETWTVRTVPRHAATDATEVPPVGQVVHPLPFAQRPEVLEALRAAPDNQGIPSSLYALDPLLSAHRREMETQASARHRVGAGVIASGLLTGALSAWVLTSGHRYLQDPRTENYGAELVTDGVILGMASLSEIIAGIVLEASRSDAGPLQHYYRETYVTPSSAP